MGALVEEALKGGQGLEDRETGSSAIESCFNIVEAPRRLLLLLAVVEAPKPTFECISPEPVVVTRPVGRLIYTL